MAAPLVVMGGGNGPPSSSTGGAPPNMNGGVGGGPNSTANAAAAATNNAGECIPPGGGAQGQQQPLRFEDLTIDDELPLLDRIARYCKSNIALQRLVHVKMLASTAEASGKEATAERILPLLPALAKDPESIIRQHVAVQLLPLAFACVGYKPDAAEGSGSSSPPNGSGSGGGAGEKSTDAASYAMLIDGVLPHLSALASDPDQDVRAAAGASIAGVCHHRLLREDDVGPLILPIPVGLSHTEPPRGGMEEERERAADLRITAAALLGDLAASLGPDLVRHFVTSEIISLAQDPIFRVRRVVANHSLPKVCAVADAEDISHRLFPVYVKLSMDESYRVRKSCADSLVELSRIPSLPSQLRTVELVQMWKRLKGDAHKAVRQSAFQNLGLLIATFAPPELLEKNSPQPSSSQSGASAKTDPAKSDRQGDEATGNNSSTGEIQPKKAAAVVDPVVHDLVPHFVSMATMDTGDAQQDAEMRLHCAYSLPAVALTVGPDGWGALRDAFALLAGGSEDGGANGGNNNVAVRRCVACSLHEIAGIVGDGDVVEKELRPAFERFLRDPSEDVRIGALRNLHRFVAVVPSRKERTAFLSAVEELLSTSSPMNWRIRNHVARQLVHLIGLFEANTVRMKMSPLLFGLLNDPVAEVRDNTYGAVSSLLRSFYWVNVARDEVPENFSDDTAVRDWSNRAVQEILSNIKRLASSEDFSHRQSFCQICARLANSLESDGCSGVSTPDEVEYLTGLLVQELLPLALIMKDDDVTNVRLTLGKALRGMPGSIRERPEVTIAVNDLDNEEGTWEEISNNNGKSITFQKSRTRGQSDRDQKRTPSRRGDKASRVTASADARKASEKQNCAELASSRKQSQKGGTNEVDGVAPSNPPELDGASEAKAYPAVEEENDKADATIATANGKNDAGQGDRGALTTSETPEGDGDHNHQSTSKKDADKQNRESDDEEQSLASI